MVVKSLSGALAVRKRISNGICGQWPLNTPVDFGARLYLFNDLAQPLLSLAYLLNACLIKLIGWCGCCYWSKVSLFWQSSEGNSCSFTPVGAAKLLMTEQLSESKNSYWPCLCWCSQTQIKTVQEAKLPAPAKWKVLKGDTSFLGKWRPFKSIKSYHDLTKSSVLKVFFLNEQSKSLCCAI